MFGNEEKLNRAKVLQYIKKDFPKVKIKDLKIRRTGWVSLIAEVNNEWIFRYPYNPELKLDTEVKILNYLKNKISIQIPVIKAIGKKRYCMLYRKIQGDLLTPALYKTFTQKQKDQYAEDLSNFFAEIHSSITVKKAQKIGVFTNGLGKFEEAVNKAFPKYIKSKFFRKMMEETMKAHKKALPRKKINALVHFDVHGLNMAIHPKTKKLVGIFDFSDSHLHDRMVDFRYIYKFTPDLMGPITKFYTKKTGHKLNLNDIKIAMWFNELKDLLFFTKNKDSRLAACQKRLKEWYKNDPLK
jgi:aminoglycoside phosphotransferase (APT) family kinase protein